MLPIDLVKLLVEASIEFGYNARGVGITLEGAKKRYDEILEELLLKHKMISKTETSE